MDIVAKRAQVAGARDINRLELNGLNDIDRFLVTHIIEIKS